MAKGRSAPSIEEIRAREETRREARKSRQRSHQTVAAKKPAVEGYRTLVLVIRDRSSENLQECYRRLNSDLITAYFKKFRYHEHRQLAVMRGTVEFPELPGGLYTEFLSELSADGKGWKQGSVSKKYFESCLTCDGEVEVDEKLPDGSFVVCEACAKEINASGGDK